MADNREHILVVGKDSMLLQTRLMLLERVGYLAVATGQAEIAIERLLSRHMSVMILCHTLTKDEISDITSVHHQIRSTASILYLSADWRSSDLENSAICEPLRGPAAFLAAIHNLAAVHGWLSGAAVLAS